MSHLIFLAVLSRLIADELAAKAPSYVCIVFHLTALMRFIEPATEKKLRLLPFQATLWTCMYFFQILISFLHGKYRASDEKKCKAAVVSSNSSDVYVFVSNSYLLLMLH
jgi:hypothetical protein